VVYILLNVIHKQTDARYNWNKSPVYYLTSTVYSRNLCVRRSFHFFTVLQPRSFCSTHNLLWKTGISDWNLLHFRNLWSLHIPVCVYATRDTRLKKTNKHCDAWRSL
jgi:hypothetical protein